MKIVVIKFSTDRDKRICLLNHSVTEIHNERIAVIKGGAFLHIGG